MLKLSGFKEVSSPPRRRDAKKLAIRLAALSLGDFALTFPLCASRISATLR